MKLNFIVVLLLMSNTLFAQLTIFEKSNGTQTATYFDAIAFYKSLNKTSSLINMVEKGPTDAGYPLHLVLVSADKKFKPTNWHTQNKVVILINNAIHPGEPDGVDACMMLVRDICTKKIILPNNVVLAIIPIYNIGGAINRNKYSRVSQNGPVEYGFRGNAQNLDLNRDFIKNDSKESQSFAQIFHWLNPDVFIDNHVSDGADFQHTMTLITTQYEKLGPTAGTWLRNVFEPKIYESMAQKKWDVIPYVDFDAANFNKGIDMFYEPPRYSSGYAALFGTFAFIPETHMLKPYKQRVLSTYDLVQSIISITAKHGNELKKIRKKNIKELQNQSSFALKWQIDKSKQSLITFKGYAQDTAISLATGLPKMFYNHNKPYTKQVIFYNYFTPINMVQKPSGYIIPAGWQEVLFRLKLNNVQYATLKKDTTILITYYKIESYKSRPIAYEKHHPNYAVKVQEVKDSIRFFKGDFLIPLSQKNNRYIIETLEPTGEDGFFVWNFFDAILQQKEGYTDYRWEDIAANYLKTDTALQNKLTQKKMADTAFAKNANAQLDFIYKNSPYYEKVHNRYPVFKYF